ncbi:NACHT domain-containing protein [Leptolyngbya sp. FACHB-17]|uniref:NACHT domain-containing protein n=1 Tax=unclassified Leptolyngbya TaxID=2650499 RepID=UPI0016807EB2|nr:NACHT domain-containing protein [Leptolyngbya sp. FACHB-17]MBD2080758.1 NACHT domain-containing protein [Leptolyngbya sp. FACHB-17]
MNKPQLPLDPDQLSSSELDAQSEEKLRQNASNSRDRHISVGGNVERSAVISGDSNTVVIHNCNQAPSIPRSSTEQKLLNQVKAEVASRLQQSLHNAIFINLIKDAQPTQVARLWDTDVKIGSTPPQALPENTTILQVFDRADIAGRLLILGKPGAGKTTTQLELAKDLCERYEQQSNYPIPVLFNLSTWKTTTRSIPSWLVAELNSKYGLGRDIGVQWLKEFKLLPLLDGLDELDSQRQLPCIHAINEFISGESAPSYLVVGSRFEEYERLNAPLQLNGAICLRELIDRQIQNYLASANRSVLWNTIAGDESLLEFVRPPLLLSMAVLAYQGEAELE